MPYKLKVSSPPSLPDKSSPLEPLFSENASSHTTQLTSWSAPVVKANSVSIEYHRESRKGRVQLGTAVGMPVGSASWEAPTSSFQSSVGPQTASLFPAECMEGKPICLYFARTPRRGCLPGELAPTQLLVWRTCTSIYKRVCLGNPGDSLES